MTSKKGRKYWVVPSLYNLTVEANTKQEAIKKLMKFTEDYYTKHIQRYYGEKK